MTRLQALEALLDQVKAGEWDFRHDAPARLVFPYHSASADDLGLDARAAFEGSLDAAKALHEAVLPGWPWTIENMNSGLSRAWVNSSRGLRTPGYVGESDDPARAWLIAILKAIIAEEEAND